MAILPQLILNILFLISSSRKFKINCRVKLPFLPNNLQEIISKSLKTRKTNNWQKRHEPNSFNNLIITIPCRYQTITRATKEANEATNPARRSLR